MNLLIITSLTLVFLIIYNNYRIEQYFNYVDKMQLTHNETTNFCKELKNLDRKSNDTLLLKKFKDRILKKKREQISELQREIDDIYKKRINNDIKKQGIYRLDFNDRVKKQLNAINIAKEKISNKGTIDININ